jgi:nucleoside-diphosphate-sugar epimerase
MRVLVTGATGFLGARLVRRLLHDGAPVAALLRPGSDARRIADLLGQLTVIRGDLRAIELCERPVAQFAPDTMLHLAWHGVAGRDRNDPRQIDDNILPTIELARLAARVGVGTWIGLGSQAEYGPQEGRVDEHAPVRPTTLYGKAKLAAGLLAGHVCVQAGLRGMWVRLFSTFGPGDNPDWLLPYVIRTLARRERPALSAGEQRWDFLFVDDAVDALVRLASTPGAGGVFNLGSGVARSLRSVIEQVRDMIDPSLPLGFGEVPYRPDQVMHLEADVARLRAATGWQPATPWETALRRTAEFFSEH